MEGCELEVLRGMDAASWAITRQVVAEVRPAHILHTCRRGRCKVLRCGLSANACVAEPHHWPAGA